MKSLLIGFLSLSSLNVQAAGTNAVQEILRQNIGMNIGVVNDGSSCDLEMNDSVLPGHIVVYAGMHANVTVMVYPNPVALWELNASTNTLLYFVDSKKENSVQMTFDPISFKVKSFTSFSKDGSLPGNTCLLN